MWQMMMHVDVVSKLLAGHVCCRTPSTQHHQHNIIITASSTHHHLHIVMKNIITTRSSPSTHHHLHNTIITTPSTLHITINTSSTQPHHHNTIYTSPSTRHNHHNTIYTFCVAGAPTHFAWQVRRGSPATIDNYGRWLLLRGRRSTSKPQCHFA